MKITIHFDGGCKVNPGWMYGSYSILIDGMEIISKIEQYGHGTNNQAEFMALYKAVERTLDLLDCRRLDPRTVEIDIFTDSEIVQNRISRPDYVSPKKYQFTPGAIRMKECTKQCMSLINRFAGYNIAWNSREVNVEKFGH